MLGVALTMAALLLASQQDICGAQLSIHTDSNTNSFSLKTPGLQQTFTRYYGGARTQPQEAEQPQQGQAQALVQQQHQQQQQQEQLANQYQLSRLQGGKPKVEQSYATFRQQYQQQLQQQQQQQQLLQQQALLSQSGFGNPAGSQGAGAGSAAGLATYSDQQPAGFLDYQRRRAEFEQLQQQQLQQQQLQQQQQQQLQQQQLQQQLFQSFNPYYPEVQPQAQQQQQPAEGVQGANGFGYQRQQFLQPGGSAGPAVGAGFQRPVGASDFYSSQQHQDVLREQQQQLAAQQFANGQVASTATRMAVPTSSAPSAPSFQPSSDVSHVSFSSGNLKYNF